MATNPAYLQALNAPATAGRLLAFLDPDEPATVSVPVPHDFVPSSAADLAVCLSDPMWRICSGVLYKIMVKGDDNDDSDDALLGQNFLQHFEVQLLRDRMVLKPHR